MRGQLRSGEEVDEVGDEGGEPGLPPADPHSFPHQLHEGEELDSPGLGGGGNGVKQLGTDRQHPGPVPQHVAECHVPGTDGRQQGDDGPGGVGLVVQA